MLHTPELRAFERTYRAEGPFVAALTEGQMQVNLAAEGSRRYMVLSLSAVYDAYDEAWPLQPGWRARIPAYTLYHVINHANLFGGGYAGSTQQMIGQLVS